MPRTINDILSGVDVNSSASRDQTASDFGKRLNELLNQMASGGGYDAGELGRALGGAENAGAPGDGSNQAAWLLRTNMQAMGAQGALLDEEENRRRDEALGFFRGEFDQFNKSFEESERGLRDTQFSYAADQAGGEARQGISDLRGLLGARGLGAGSGAAAGLASGIALRQQGQITGARRDIALQAAQRQALQRAQRAELAGSLTGLINQGPSMIGLDTITNLTDIGLARTGEENQLKEARKARSAATTAGWLNLGTKAASLAVGGA